MYGIPNLSSLTALGSKGANGAFSPSQISGLALWLDASDQTTITVTSSPDVDSWTDKVAGHVFAQSTAAAKPHTGASVNGRNAITFDGTDDYLNKVASDILVGSVGIIFTVFRTPGALPASNASALSTGSDAGAPTGAFCAPTGVQNSAGTRYNRIIEKSSSGDAQTTIRGSTGMAINSTYVLAASSTGSAYGLRVNGATETITVGAGSDNGNWFAQTTTPNNTTVGAILRDGVIAGPMWGDVCEILAYDGVTLTSTQIDQVESYLAAKWGVTLA